MGVAIAIDPGTWECFSKISSEFVGVLVNHHPDLQNLSGKLPVQLTTCSARMGANNSEDLGCVATQKEQLKVHGECNNTYH